MIITIVSIIIFLVLIWIIYIYNQLMYLKDDVKKSWLQVENILKKRFNLIANLVQVASRYKPYEQQILNELTNLHTQFKHMRSRTEKVKLNYRLTELLNQLLVKVENYPDFKVSEHFLFLVTELSDLEFKVKQARENYNDCVEGLNKVKMRFPTYIIANLFGFKDDVLI